VEARTVIEILNVLESHDIDVWVDGGWAVDALLGEQTRPHNDLDIVLPHTQLLQYEQVVASRAFRVDVKHTDFNWESVDPQGNRIDVHLVDLTSTRIDRYGMAVYGPAGLEYEVGCLNGTGTIAGRTIRCLNAEVLVRYHTGYELADTDYHDVHRLHERFGIPLPYPYDPDGDRTDWTNRLVSPE
jgi:lincosamide nucleotidyltransferase A/C/D/E